MFYDLKALEYAKVLSMLEPFAKTNYAKEKINNLVPAKSYEEANTLLLEVKDAYNAVVKNSDLPLGGLYSVKNAIERARIGGILNEEELLNVVGLLECTTNVIKYFKQLDLIKVDYSNLKKYSDVLVEPKALKTNITLAISPEGKVVDNASRELFMVRRAIASLENRLRSKLNELLNTRASQLTEQLIVLRDGRLCLPVKIEYKNTFKGIVHDISSSNTTAYIEPESTLETSNQIESYKTQEKKEIQIVLKNLSLLVGSESEVLLANLESLTALDVIFAKALMGKEYDYNPAKISDKQSFVLKKAKHPLIAKDVVVPIDIELGNKFKAIIITGPNTGGKTVALKTTGLLHLMALSGMMVPASEDSTFGYFEEILVDIGDEQSIEQSLSTFSSHMTKIISVLNNVSITSLVLLDELGSGTDPKEGSSLAVAIINYLKNAGACVISTTHYSELKNYAYNNEGVVNASVEFNTTTLMPTYKLLLGVPGKSNALEIAKRLGLSDAIIEASKAEMESTNSSSGKLMNNLEEEITQMREKEEELEKKISEYEAMVRRVEAEKINIVKNTDKIIKEAKKEAEKIVSDARSEANSLIEELKELKKGEHKDHELADLTHKARNLSVNATEEQLFEEELAEGDYVYVKPYEKYGTITKIKKDKYLVNIGQFAMDFKKTELVKSQKPVEKKKKETRMSGYNPASHASLSCDLRGKRYEEVKVILDQYFDQALLGNLDFVTIIHGFGTGAIRKAVWDYLKNQTFVKSYRYGQEGEGLNGVTVVYLK